ncbi:MAG: putative nucleic acid-binding protein, contains PIN domain [Parcubacteria group bacterium Gr01-1014_70]|nr:MAG: putative nucleic acid-binding protein, contains PIN domain [Parcubacteria group bacterium Gr01-1014_70]
MEENKRVFVDSNYFIALFNPADSLHKQAISVGRKLHNERTQLVISNLVFLEVVTVLSQKMSRNIAIQVGDYFIASPQVKLLHVDEVLQNEAWTVFTQTPLKNMSFVDCGIIACMKKEHIIDLLTFDKKDFQQLRKLFHFELYY